MPETIAADAVIDVYADVIPEPRQRGRGARPTQHPLGPVGHPNGGSPHDFLTPKPDPAVIERPSVWRESSLTRQELLARIETFPACATPRVMKEHFAGAAMVLDWLEGFPGLSWQQRWRASGADEAGDEWMAPLATARRRRIVVSKGVGELILADAIRPSYNWLYRFRSAKFFARFRDLRDHDAFALLDALCDQRDRMTELARLEHQVLEG